MSSTTHDAEQDSKSGGPQGCVDRRQSAASLLLCDMCRFVTLLCISMTFNKTGPWRFWDGFYNASSGSSGVVPTGAITQVSLLPPP
jgi:hypothetical protein